VGAVLPAVPDAGVLLAWDWIRFRIISCISLLRRHGVPSLERLAHSEEVILQRGVLEWLVTIGILAQSRERVIHVLRFGQVA